MVILLSFIKKLYHKLVLLSSHECFDSRWNKTDIMYILERRFCHDEESN